MKLRRLVIIPGVAMLALVAAALSSGVASLPLARVEGVSRHTLVATAIGNGQLRPARYADVETEASGRVTDLRVKEGSVVKAGDVILRMDRTDYEMAVTRSTASLGQARSGADQVRTNLVLAQAGLRRAEGIAEGTGLLAAADLEQARAQVKSLEASYQGALSIIEQAQAQVDEAKRALQKTVVVAPISGTVIRLRARLGELIAGSASGGGIATIADLSSIDAVVSISETDLPRVHVGDSAAVKVEALGRERLGGRVTHIGPASLAGAAAKQNSLYQVVVTLLPTTRLLYPDLSVTVEIVAERRTNTLAVPLLAVVMRDFDGMRASTSRARNRDKTSKPPVIVEGVFVLKDGIARFRSVRSGIVGDQYVEIRRGLAEGERVIVGPYQLLRELEGGMEVEPDAVLMSDAGPDSTGRPR